MVAAVPGVDGLAGHVVEHPAFARLHAGLVDARAEHVVVVAHDDAVLGVDDLALVAFDVEDRRGWRTSSSTIVPLRSNLLCATVRKVRPSESAWATDGRRRVDRGLCARRLVPDGPSASVLAAARARWAGSRHSARRRKNSPTSGSVLGSAISTVSLTSQVSCRQGSKTTFSQV